MFIVSPPGYFTLSLVLENSFTGYCNTNTIISSWAIIIEFLENFPSSLKCLLFAGCSLSLHYRGTSLPIPYSFYSPGYFVVVGKCFPNNWYKTVHSAANLISAVDILTSMLKVNDFLLDYNKPMTRCLFTSWVWESKGSPLCSSHIFCGLLSYVSDTKRGYLKSWNIRS